MSADECYCAVEPWPGGAWPDPCDYCTRKAKERDARPDDMASLRAQLADAVKVVEAAREVGHCADHAANCCVEWCRVCQLFDKNNEVFGAALATYDAKHGAK